MKIDSIRIRGYRSLYEVNFSPTNFSALVGPNNSGKSNLVEAIDFLADVHRYGVNVAVARKGGYDNIAHRRVRRTKKPITFEIEATLSSDELEEAHRYFSTGRQPRKFQSLQVFHSFSIGPSGSRIDAEFSVVAEELELRDTNSMPPVVLATVRRTANVIDVNVGDVSDGKSEQELANSTLFPLQDDSFLQFANRVITPTGLLTRALEFNQTVRVFAETLSRTKVYQLSPIECRKPGISTPNAEISLHGQNLPALVAYMRENLPNEWERVLSAMQRIVPGLNKVDTHFTHDRQLYLRFYEEGVGRPWTSEDVSDGTIQSLALFAALYDPRSPLILIEEPENSVHPWIVRSFVNACRNVENKQILLTTHSPELLNQLRPNEVSIIWRHAGKTHLAPLTQLDPEAEGLWASGRGGVYELLNSGLIREAIPGGFQ